MLRSVLGVASQPAVVLLNHYSWYLSRGYGVSSGLFFSGPESAFNDLAQVRGCSGLVMLAWVFGEGAGAFGREEAAAPLWLAWTRSSACCVRPVLLKRAARWARTQRAQRVQRIGMAAAQPGYAALPCPPRGSHPCTPRGCAVL